MEAKTTDTGQRTNRQNVDDSEVGRQGATTFWVPFTTKEVLRLAPGLSASTLKYWHTGRRWITPRRRGRQGTGGDTLWSAWQTIALVIMASVLRDKRDQRSYLGNVGVRNAWVQLSGLSDELLLDDQQDMRLSEEVAAALGRMASGGPELPPDVLDGVARVVQAIDRKVGAIRARENRMR